MFGEKPVAYARIKGSGRYPNLSGLLYLFPAQGGTIVWVELREVTDMDGKPAQGFRGFHIHGGSACTGNEKDFFGDTGSHYNPTDREHPEHAGDLPPVLVSNGYAWMEVYTGRFHPENVVDERLSSIVCPTISTRSPPGIPAKRLLVESLNGCSLSLPAAVSIHSSFIANAVYSFPLLWQLPDGCIGNR